MPKVARSPRPTEVPLSHPAHPRRNATLPSVANAIANRWSPRGFDAAFELDESAIGTLLDAARWAPSASNTQPWSFIVAMRGTPEHERVAASLAGFNASWAPRASALLVGIVERERDGKPLRWADHDLGQACAFLVLQAETMGLDAHQKAGFDTEQIARGFGVEAPFAPVVAIAVGRHDASDEVPAEIRLRDQAPRERKPLAAMRFPSSAR